MKIALCMEESQAGKNEIIWGILKKAADKYGHTAFNYGVYAPDDAYKITYTQLALLNAILLNGKAVDFVVTGCSTGMGALIATNTFPGVQCGFAADPVDAKLLREINQPNAVSTPFAKGFGRGAEINLELIFDQLFNPQPGERYLEESSVQACKKYRSELGYAKGITHSTMMEILNQYDPASLKHTLSNPKFKEYFYVNCQDEEILQFVKEAID
jgi:ribose 5-phosphate isomerase RpiB